MLLAFVFSASFFGIKKPPQRTIEARGVVSSNVIFSVCPAEDAVQKPLKVAAGYKSSVESAVGAGVSFPK